MDAGQKSFNSLIQSLDADEEVLYFIRATMVENPNPREERGILAVTTKRVLFKEHSWFGTVTSLQWPWDWLKGISSKKGLTFEHIRIKSPGGTEKFLVDYGDADLFVNSVNEAADSQH